MVVNPFAAGDPTSAPAFTEPGLLASVDGVDAIVPRGEPRRLVADLAQALAARAPLPERDERLDAAAAALAEPNGVTASEPRALALAFLAALPVLARADAVRGPLAALEPRLAALDDEDRARAAPALARVAAPALGVDLEVMKDEGYRYVATYIREGSEGVDIAGRAASWLTRRMTVVHDGPRVAMRRFLAVLAEEIEVELPVTAALLDALLEEPPPETPAQDAPFLALARGLVEEAIAERGPPW
jgi:hypothetical protein